MSKEITTEPRLGWYDKEKGIARCCCAKTRCADCPYQPHTETPCASVTPPYACDNAVFHTLEG